MRKEIWKSIRDFELYEVSNCGRIRRLPAKIHRGGNKDYDCFWQGRVLKNIECSINDKGWQTYLSVSLTKNGKHFPRLVHRLVAEAFIPNPENKSQVNHKDGNKHNNNVGNLEWVSPSENTKHAIYISKKNGRVVSVECVETGVVFQSIAEASRWIKRRHVCIDVCLKNPNRTAGGYHWRRKIPS